MMKLVSIISPVLALTATLLLSPSAVVLVAGQAACVKQPLYCTKIGVGPVVDASLSEWSDDKTSTLSAPIYNAINRELYDDGNMKVRCRYNDTLLFLAVEVPGLFRFNASDNHFCASIATMMKIGKDATFFNMGGCPDAIGGCAGGVPASCNSYRVDLGAHWELRTTQQRTLYNVNITSSVDVGSGNDLTANKDDEYGVSPFCKFDDDDGVNASNEWAAAWAHTKNVTGEPGTYIFEMSRLLRTKSNITDLQLFAGGSYPFGLAFWDPFESAKGWTDSGHYLTGCAADWIDLILFNGTSVPPAPTKAPVAPSPPTAPTPPTTPTPPAPTPSDVCTGSATLKCTYVTTAPIIDANLSDWTGVAATKTSLYHAINRQLYDDGQITYKCLYNDNDIFLSLEVPGLFRFNASDNHLCAGIATMLKIGKDATFYNMGGCPEAASGCNGSVPASCDNYRVDIGAHWELRTTQQRTRYGVNISAAGVVGSGNDLTANKDDEYGVSPFCKFDDDDGVNAGNEWAGAWAHSTNVTGQPGTYIFELSRSLKTKSNKTDAQLEPNKVYSFGLAFWDPYESDKGWTDSGHYVTGCGSNWFNLEIVAKPPANNSMQIMFAILVLMYAAVYYMIYGVSRI